MKILHIIGMDKFTTGYINFMKLNMGEYQHYFFVCASDKYSINPVNEQNIIYFHRGRELVWKSAYRKLLHSADKIIMSGGWFATIGLLDKSIHDKLYIQFWGGDFYSLRDRMSFWHLGYWLKRFAKLYTFSHCKKRIFLIDDDRNAFERITGIKGEFMTAAMPGDPLNVIDYDCCSTSMNTDKPRILVGNSATKENHHLDVFSLLKKHAGKIEVMCPLSYGDEAYGKMVRQYGKKFFGNDFISLDKMMDKQMYANTLATCQVGIFYHDRQQSMGNIMIMSRLRKKLYLRRGTSMWDNFYKSGLVLHDVEDIGHETLSELFSMENQEGELNAQAAVRSDPKVWEEMWHRVLGE